MKLELGRESNFYSDLNMLEKVAGKLGKKSWKVESIVFEFWQNLFLIRKRKEKIGIRIGRGIEFSNVMNKKIGQWKV